MWVLLTRADAGRRLMAGQGRVGQGEQGRQGLVGWLQLVQDLSRVARVTLTMDAILGPLDRAFDMDT